MPDGLWDTPASWEWVTLGEYADWSSGGTPKATDGRFYGGKIPWLIIGDLNDGPVTTSAKTITNFGLENSSAKWVEPGALLIAMYGSIGKLGIARLRCTTNQAIAFTRRIHLGADSRYLFLYLLHVRNRLLSEGKGGTQQNISQTVLKGFLICVPPIPEQRRIVARLEELLSEVNACQKRLERISLILRRLRQSVLAAACSGRLTEDWRKQTSLQAPAVDAIESKDSLELELPDSWQEVYLGTILSSLKYGTARRCDYSKKGVPVLRIPNVQNGIVDSSDLKYAVLSKSELRELALDAGDLLMVRSNGSVSLVGRAAVVGDGERGYAYAGYLMRLRPNRDLVDHRYLAFALRLSSTRTQIEVPARSTSGVHNINSGEVRGLVLPLPPKEEQFEIVRRVDALFKLADEVESRYQSAKASVDQLTQSILAKAFRGELLPQDPKDEPASALLERIRRSAHPQTAPRSSARKRALAH